MEHARGAAAHRGLGDHHAKAGDQGAQLDGQRRVAGCHQHGHAQHAGHVGVEAAFAHGGAVEPEARHRAGPGMGEEPARGAGHRVIADEHHAIVRRVEALYHPVRLERALDVLDPGVELRVQEILVIAVGVVHHDLRGTGREDRLDHGIHFRRHQLAAGGIVLPVRRGHRRRPDAADPFHVDRDEDPDRAGLGRNGGDLAQGQQGQGEGGSHCSMWLGVGCKVSPPPDTAVGYRGHMVRLFIAFLLSAAAGGPLAAQQPDSVTIPAGSRYVARGPLAWLSTWIFGSRYRELWGIPVRMPRLDPVALGLTPLGADTGMRAGFLYFRDGGGATWTFRPLDRNIESLVSAQQRRDVMTGPIQDLYSGRHPGAPLVLASLARGAGLGVREPRLVALVTDTVLTPGFIEAGIETRFRDELDEKSSAITSTELLAQLDAPDPPTVDAVAYLRERLFDIYVGSWDALPDEWLWLRRRGGLMVPLPARPRWRILAVRRTGDLPGVDDDVGVLELQGRVRVEAADDGTAPGPRSSAAHRTRFGALGRDHGRPGRAPHRFPARARRGTAAARISRHQRGDLLRQLQVRREQLPEITWRYHDLLLDRGELYGTTKADTILARRVADGVLDVSIGGGVPIRFESRVTDEVRLYPLAGPDRIVLRGGDYKGPRLRVPWIPWTSYPTRRE
jgi:hypothetical protein